MKKEKKSTYKTLIERKQEDEETIVEFCDSLDYKSYNNCERWRAQNNIFNERERRKPIKLLPRSIPIERNILKEAKSSRDICIFGTGKPRDINDPEIRRYDEYIENKIVLQSAKHSDNFDKNSKQRNSSTVAD